MLCCASCFSRIRLFATLWTIDRQTSLSTGFSRQEYWSGLPRPPPGDLPDPGIKLACLLFPVLAGGFFTTSATWEAHFSVGCFLIVVMSECWCFLCRCYLVEVNFFKCIIFHLRDLMCSKNYQTVIVLQKDSINYFMECCYLLLP